MSLLTHRAVLVSSLFSLFLGLLLITPAAASPVMFSQIEVLKSVPNDSLGTIFDSIIDPRHSQDQSALVAPPHSPKHKATLTPPKQPAYSQPLTTPSIPPITKQAPHNDTSQGKTKTPPPYKPIKPESYRPPSKPVHSKKANHTHQAPKKEVAKKPPPPAQKGESKIKGSHMSILLWILMLLLYLFFKAVHYWWALLPTPALSRSLIQLDSAYYAFYRQICFFISVIGVLLFFSLFLSASSGHSLRQVIFAFTHFLFFWFMGGFLILIVAEVKARQWLKYESLIVRSQEWADRIQKQYELHYLQHKEAQLRPFVQYLVMRQEFITPSYLPMLRHSFHRSDFNFADYLVRCLSHTLAKFFSLRILSLAFCLVLFLLAHFFSAMLSSGVEAIGAVIFLLLVLLCTQLNLLHLDRILQKLVPPIQHPSYVNLQLELDTIDPFQHYNRLLRPEYLGGQNDDERQSESGIESSQEQLPRFGREQDERHRLSGWDVPQPRRTNIRVGGASKPATHCWCIHSNRHQSLFCCGRIGISVLFAGQQLLFLSSMLTLNYFIFSNAPGSMHEKESKLGDYGIAILLILLLVLLALFVLLQMPLWAIRHTLCTSLQMMKKRAIEAEVLQELQLRAIQRNVRLFQTFKLIRRELLQDQAPLQQVKLRRISRRLLYQVFSLYQKQRKNGDLGSSSFQAASSPFIVDSKDCEQMSRLCGNRLTRRQQFLLLKSTKSRSAISFTDALYFIEGNMNDAVLTVNQVIEQLFALYYNQAHSPTHLSLEDLLGFFHEFETYFEAEDMSEFLEEIKLAMREKQHRPDQVPLLSLTTEEIALRLRNEIDRFPR